VALLNCEDFLKRNGYDLNEERRKIVFDEYKKLSEIQKRIGQRELIDIAKRYC